jgi:hypothetical protein
LTGQDSYSYQLARIHTGARDEAELRAKYQHCVQALPFDVQEPAKGT